MSNEAEYLSSSGRQLLERREFLDNSATALGSIALTSLLGSEGLLAAKRPKINPSRPYAPRAPHFVQSKERASHFLSGSRQSIGDMGL